MHTPIRTALLAAALAVAACSEPLTAPSLDDLSAAPETVIVAGTTLELETTLWRDFMPVAPPDGQPLMAHLRVRTSDGSPIPEGLVVEAAYVVHGAEIWVAVVEPSAGSESADVLEVMARGGPKWGPGVEVDAVVRIRHGVEETLLRASDQPIVRTD